MYSIYSIYSIYCTYWEHTSFAMNYLDKANTKGVELENRGFDGKYNHKNEIVTFFLAQGLDTA